MAARQFFLGLMGGSIAAVSFYNFSRTSMENDFAFVRSKLDAMSSQLQALSRDGKLQNPLFVHRPAQKRIAKQATLLDASRDAWNGAIVRTTGSLLGRCNATSPGDRPRAASTTAQLLATMSAKDAPPTAELKKLNLNAQSFVPNPNAAEFVPSWLPPSMSAPQQQSASVKPVAQVLKLSSSEPKANIPKIEKQEVKSEPKVVAARGQSPASRPDESGSSKIAGDAADTQQASIDPVKTAEEEELEYEFFSTKDHMNIVFIGHVDAGKSTMGGQILRLTGMVDKRTLEKYEKEAKDAGRESWYLSWALDTNKEERAKGKTVEVGRAHFETETRRYTILDAPGHKLYVHNMIGGASQADVAVLVISARRGEFETGFEKGGQTQEHAMLVKTNGVNRIIVAINKMDDPTVNWSKERYEECKSKHPYSDVYFLPVSGFMGVNLKERIDKSLCDYYDGPSLFEILDTLTIDNKLALAPLMMPISDRFKDMGLMVVGKIEAGRVRKGSTVLIMPNRRQVEVLSVLIDDEEVNNAKAGENAQLKLKGIEEEDISLGSVLTSVENPIRAVLTFDAHLVIIESERIITAGYQAIMHIHNLVEEVTITELLHSIDKKTGRRTKKPPMFTKRGQMVIARIECSLPICCDTYKNHAQLGRFTLRHKTTTVAMGKITRLCE